MTRTAIIPVRDFHGMTRLASAFSAAARTELARRLASISVIACAEADMKPMVLTRDAEVSSWAQQVGVEVTLDRGSSLSTAVQSAVEDHPTWMVVHADLPLADGPAVTDAALAADSERFAVAPSLDGGTNLIAGSGRFGFSFGPGSFTRHLALAPTAAVLVDRRLALELDTPAHAAALSTIGGLSSLDL